MEEGNGAMWVEAVTPGGWGGAQVAALKLDLQSTPP